ncbi:MAG TPA: oligosaccharide flippase family protein [Candidatus Paceibacterota bacterium]|nr:oligosaccharide flippase family protein [Candidatus Paceibacterota bacterium]
MPKKTEIIICEWLKWGEKYLKTDLTYFAKGGFWLGSGFGVSMISTFILSLAFANLLPQESYGIYKYIFSLVGIAGSFYLTGLSTIVSRSVSRGFEGTLFAAVKTSLKWSFIPTIISLSISIFYFYNGNYVLGGAMLIPTLTNPFSNSYSMYSAFLVGKKEFKTTTYYSTISNYFINASLIISLFFTQNPAYIIAVYFIMQMLLVVFFYLLTIKKYSPSKDVEKGAIVYGKHLSVMSVLGTISSNIDKILVFHYLGAAPLAIYSIASAPVDQINALFKQTTHLFMPKISSQNKEEVKKNLPGKSMMLTVIMIVPTIVYILLIPYFYKIFFPKYVSSIIYSQFLALTLLTYPKKPLNIAIVAHGDKKINYFLSVFNPMVLLILKIILLPIWGLTGAIAAEVISPFIYMFVNLYILRRI